MRYQQLQLFSRPAITGMRDRTRARNYSPEKEQFRRDHARRRRWGLPRRHAQKLCREHGCSRECGEVGLHDFAEAVPPLVWPEGATHARPGSSAAAGTSGAAESDRFTDDDRLAEAQRPAPRIEAAAHTDPARPEEPALEVPLTTGLDDAGGDCSLRSGVLTGSPQAGERDEHAEPTQPHPPAAAHARPTAASVNARCLPSPGRLWDTMNRTRPRRRNTKAPNPSGRQPNGP